MEITGWNNRSVRSVHKLHVSSPCVSKWHYRRASCSINMLRTTDSSYNISSCFSDRLKSLLFCLSSYRDLQNELLRATVIRSSACRQRIHLDTRRSWRNKQISKPLEGKLSEIIDVVEMSVCVCVLWSLFTEIFRIFIEIC